MTNEDPLNIIPFGKHKGKTVEEVQLVEPGYLDWLIGQPWFRDRHVILYQTVINRGAEPEDTPDHNALQVLFLEDAFCLKLIAVLGFDPAQSFERDKQISVADARDTLKLQGDHFDAYKARYPGWETDKFSNASWHQRLVAEAKDTLLKRLARTYKASVERRAFEANGIDVLFEVPYAGRFVIEIKPTVGDDYPAVLRQINALTRIGVGVQGEKVLFLERYVGIGATRDQFIAVFKQAGISVVFRDQVK